MRRRSCQSRQTTFNARAVCSIVNASSGFFPPEPGRLLGHEQHHRLAEDHVSEHGGEIAIFRRCGMHPVFFGQAVAGAKRPT